LDSVGSFDFVSTNEAQVKKFDGKNRDASKGLDGPQGGLLDDSAARGGLGVIDNSVVILLTLDADPSTKEAESLDVDQQTALLDSLLTDSIVEYGSNAAFGYPDGDEQPIPEPGTLLLLSTGLAGLAGYSFRRRKKA